MSLFGSTTAFSDKEKNTKIDHVLIGIVTANADDKGHTYRVKVRIPSLVGGGEGDKVQDSTHWCRIASFMAGEHVGDDASSGPRGAYFMPEIGDEVLVAFEHGDISRPIVIGRMWSDVAPDKTAKGGDDGAPNRPIYAHTSLKGVLADSPDEKDVKGPSLKTKHETKKNDLSGISTRSGHKLVFNDNKTEGAVYLGTTKKHRIELVDGGKQGVLIADSNGNYVWLKSGSASGDIEIKTEGNITLDAKKSIILKAGKTIETTSDSDTKVTSKAKFQVDAHGELSLTTAASGSFHASGSLKLTGSPINHN